MDLNKSWLRVAVHVDYRLVLAVLLIKSWANHRRATAVPVVLVPPGGYRPSGGFHSFKSLPAGGMCQEKGFRDDAPTAKALQVKTGILSGRFIAKLAILCRDDKLANIPILSGKAVPRSGVK